MEWFCKRCNDIIKKPIVCVGNHECVKCDNCRGTDIELVTKAKPHKHPRKELVDSLNRF